MIYQLYVLLNAYTFIGMNTEPIWVELETLVSGKNYKFDYYSANYRDLVCQESIPLSDELLDTMADFHPWWTTDLSKIVLSYADVCKYIYVLFCVQSNNLCPLIRTYGLHISLDQYIYIYILMYFDHVPDSSASIGVIYISLSYRLRTRGIFNTSM